MIGGFNEASGARGGLPAAITFESGCNSFNSFSIIMKARNYY
jgi:hypothetical protein